MSEPIRVSGHPKTIASVLKNAIAMVVEAAGEPQTLIPFVRLDIALPTGPTEGTVRATGIGRYTAGTDVAEIEADGSDRAASIRVLAVNAEKTDVVDDLQKLAMAIQRTSTARDARVHLVLEEGVSLSAYYGEEFLGELAEMDPEGLLEGDEEHMGPYEEFHQELHELLLAEETTKRLAFMVPLIKRLANVSTPDGCRVVDFKVHPSKPLVAFAVGPTFRGLYAGIERDGFASGGPWSDGPGTPESLIA